MIFFDILAWILPWAVLCFCIKLIEIGHDLDFAVYNYVLEFAADDIHI